MLSADGGDKGELTAVCIKLAKFQKSVQNGTFQIIKIGGENTNI